MTRPRRPIGRPLRAAAFAVAVAALAGAPAAAEPARFVTGLEDLPLMPGLNPVANAAMSFDTPQGRIVEAFAAGAVSPGAVQTFYAQTLPQLGWRAQDQTTWMREGEVLRLEIIEGAGAEAQALTIRFALSPN